MAMASAWPHTFRDPFSIESNTYGQVLDIQPLTTPAPPATISNSSSQKWAARDGLCGACCLPACPGRDFLSLLMANLNLISETGEGI